MPGLAERGCVRADADWWRQELVLSGIAVSLPRIPATMRGDLRLKGESLTGLQLPAVVGRGMTVVVSPLLSLMQDQVRTHAATHTHICNLTCLEVFRCS